MLFIIIKWNEDFMLIIFIKIMKFCYFIQNNLNDNPNLFNLINLDNDKHKFLAPISLI